MTATKNRSCTGKIRYTKAEARAVATAGAGHIGHRMRRRR